MGITKVDTILMILGISLKMKEIEREVTTSLMIQGFNDIAKEAKTSVTGGQTVFNPWTMIGGTAMSVVSEDEMIRPNNAKENDVLILTKPLGTQLAVNFNQWMKLNDKNWEILQKYITQKDVLNAYAKAIHHMSTLNLIGAQLMRKYKAHAATDVTGFGIFGHANNLAIAQKEKVNLILHSIPIIKEVAALDKIIVNFRLKEGFSAETSGGLLMCIGKDVSSSFIKEYKDLTGSDAWIIGEVVKGENKAVIVPDLHIIEA